MTASYAPLVAATSKGNTGTATESSSAATPEGADAVGSLGSAGLFFTGYIRAKVGNTNAVLVQGASQGAVNGTLEANDPPIFLYGVDLSQINVKSAHAGDIVKLAGKVDQL